MITGGLSGDAARMRLCIHEAGHCVAMHALGLVLCDFQLADEDGCCGGEAVLRGISSLRALDHDDPQTAVLLEARTVALLAGPSAEGLASPSFASNDPLLVESTVLSNVESSWRGDKERLLDVLLAIPGDDGDREAYLQQAIERAEQLVTLREAAVLAVAEALMDDGLLPAGRARELIASAL